MSRVKDLPWPSRMADDEWAEVSEGLPTKDEPFINKYLMGREALILQEKTQRSGQSSLSSKTLYITHKSSTQTMHSGNLYLR